MAPTRMPQSTSGGAAPHRPRRGRRRGGGGGSGPAGLRRASLRPIRVRAGSARAHRLGGEPRRPSTGAPWPGPGLHSLRFAWIAPTRRGRQKGQVGFTAPATRKGRVRPRQAGAQAPAAGAPTDSARRRIRAGERPGPGAGTQVDRGTAQPFGPRPGRIAAPRDLNFLAF